ncbi:MAG TPA: hypothetical protein EYN69_00550 [Flavobacteriales bacterium]|nr:hypothetical protein [Flavobacteriales bacterium]
MAFITEYPIWFIFLCFLLGLLCSFILYWRDSHIAQLKKWLQWSLATIRFLFVSFLAFLLLGPMLKTISSQVEKPIIIVAQDNSASILIGKDSAYIEGEFKPQMEELIAELRSDYDVNTYSFGEGVGEGLGFTFDEKQTDISLLFKDLYNIYSNRNVGAIIVASDGIFNKGVNPKYSVDLKRLKTPLYVIAMGDTSVKRDLAISGVRYNRLAYLGNTFPVEIDIVARQCAGENSKVFIAKDGKEIYSQKIAFDQSSSFLQVAIQIEAEEEGIQHYAISLEPLEDEITITNNRWDIYIDVLDSRQKILILANSPHPDLASLTQAIVANDNYQVEEKLVSEYNKSVLRNTKEFEQYNLIILHQLPSHKYPLKEFFGAIESTSLPLLTIIGSQTNLKSFNSRKTCVSITGAPSKFNEVTPELIDEFALFQLEQEHLATIKKMPPLLAPFGTYKADVGTSAFFNQKIGVVVTQKPLIIFNGRGEAKSAVITGEGLWRWQLHDAKMNGNHEIYNNLISKIVQYLSVRVNKSKFRIISKNNFIENEPLSFEAEVYNESYDLINDGEVSMTITDEGGNKFPYAFSKSKNSFRLDAGIFPVGEYEYEATTRVGDKVYNAGGELSVSPILVESISSIANHKLLASLASEHDGEMVLNSELKTVVEKIKARTDIASVSYSSMHLREMINLKWIFYIVLTFISLEWFLRKRNGTY